MTVTVAETGTAALESLSAGAKPESNTALPELVVIDLGVESVAGETVLDAIKSSPRLQLLPVVALTDPESASGSAGRATPLTLGANALLERPETDEAYRALAERLASFWAEWATLPAERLYSDSP